MPTARKGKVARLPHAVREEINRRLLDNQEGNRLCAWINSSQKLRGQAAITSQNLSEWRAGGFADWLEGQARVERTKQLAEFALRIAQAGGGAMDLPAAIAGGQLMEVLEAFDPSTLKSLLADDPKSWLDLIGSVASLQRARSGEMATRQNEVKLSQAERKLIIEEQMFQRTTAELFIKWHANARAAEIAENNRLKPDVKIEQLRLLMFGEAENG